MTGVQTCALPIYGFGLASIRHAARKYLGDIEIRKEICEGEECCVLRVMLQIPET